jgi:hypothetical protein
MSVPRVVLVLGILLLVAACGGTASQAGSSGTGQTVQPGTSGTASAEPTEPAIGTFVSPTAGAVTVVPSVDAFGHGDGVRAIVSNGRDAPVFLEDLHTGCTVAVLEMKQEATWVAQPDCGSEREASVVEVPAGLAFRFSIDPASIAAEGRSLEPGTYRLSVGWRSSAGPAGVVEQTVHSDTFRID